VNAGLPQLYISCLAVQGGDVLAGSNGNGGGLFRSADDGNSWTRSDSGLTDHNVNGFAALGRFLFAGTYAGGVFRSADDGRSWAPVNAGLTNMDVNALAADASALFAGTLGGGVFRSPDSGRTWTAVNAGLTNPNVKCLFAAGSVLLAGTTSYAFLSSNGGGRWDTLRYQADGFAASDTALFLCGYFAGVRSSTDNGAGWAPDTAGLSSPHVQSLAVCGPFLFAGIYNGGAWRMTLPGGTPAEKGALPLAGLLSLEQNHPNPFRSGTTLSFSVSRQTGVSLRIFNGLGQAAESLMSRDLPAGRYTVDWNASGLSCGAYFCRLEAGGLVQTKKLLLIK
jgi:hypothetical protein